MNQVTVEFASLPGWPATSQRAQVRDVWQHADLGSFATQFTSKPLAARQSQTLIVVAA